MGITIPISGSLDKTKALFNLIMEHICIRACFVFKRHVFQILFFHGQYDDHWLVVTLFAIAIALDRSRRKMLLVK